MYLAKLAEMEAVRPWLAKILAPGYTPPWVAAGAQIFRKTLSFKAKGWKIFVCTWLDPCLNENHLSLKMAVLLASIMVGYLVNVGASMSANITMVHNSLTPSSHIRAL